MSIIQDTSDIAIAPARTSVLQFVVAILVVSLLLNIGAVLYIRMLRAESKTVELELSTAIDANTGNQATITALRQAVDACVGQQQNIANLASQAAADFEKAQVERAEAARLARGKRDAILSSDPACRVWAATPVCRSISDAITGEAP